MRPCADLMPVFEHRAAAPDPPGGGTAARSLSKNGKSSRALDLMLSPAAGKVSLFFCIDIISYISPPVPKTHQS